MSPAFEKFLLSANSQNVSTQAGEKSAELEQGQGTANLRELAARREFLTSKIPLIPRMERLWEARNRKPVLVVSGAIMLLVAVVDWWTKPYVSLGFLYLFPIMLAAGFLSRWAVVLLGTSSAILAELFSSLDKSMTGLSLETSALAQVLRDAPSGQHFFKFEVGERSTIPKLQRIVRGATGCHPGASLQQVACYSSS